MQARTKDAAAIPARVASFLPANDNLTFGTTACLELDRGLHLPEVLFLTGDSKSSWYSRLNPNSPTYDPDCPRPFRLNKSNHGPVLWNAGEVLAWLRSRAAARNA